MIRVSRKNQLPVSIGICIYNEEKNIAQLLQSLLAQKTETVEIKEIIIISSGSTDSTNSIVSGFLKKYDNMKLIIQKKREGKASAVNLLFAHAREEVVALVNGDTILERDTIEKLVAPFRDPRVGMTGGHPIPVNDKTRFLGFTIHLLWSLHHLISLSSPKLGELIALRNIATIPDDTAVDEAWMEAIMKSKGFKLVYVPGAILYNMGPQTISDFLKQRRRVFAGHLRVRRNTGYELSTMNSFVIIMQILKLQNLNPKTIIYTLGAVSLELLGRILGSYDFYVRSRNPFIWEVIETTKELKG